MISTIDHQTRKKLGISSVHYLVMDLCSQYKNLLRETKVKNLSFDLGLTERAISISIDELCRCEPRLLQQHENGSFYPTEHWYLAQLGEDINVSSANTEIAKSVVTFFNEVNDSKYLIPNNSELIKNILKVYPRLTFDHFKSVILHKKETWGIDEKMSEYNRPATIFRSAQKFIRYLDDANIYWANKVKKDEYSRANR